MFSNVGEKNTALAVNVDSEVVSFEKKTRAWNVVPDKSLQRPIKYDFSILSKREVIEKINNFTIYYYYTYNDQNIFNQPIVITSQKYSCEYIKADYNDFRLINKD
jgi:hypothetical protein